MSKQASTVLGDAEYDHLTKALSKSGETLYAFVKKSIMERADMILNEERHPIILTMVEELRGRKWNLYQHDDYSDANHLAWLKTRFPQALPQEARQAVTDFRLSQQVKR